MSVFALLNLTAGVFHVLRGIEVVQLDPRSRTNRLCLYSCVLLGWWAFAYAFAQSSETAAGYWAWYRAGSVGWILVPAMLLDFFLLLAYPPGSRAHTPWRWLVHVPALIFLVRGLSGMPLVAGRITRGPLGWVEYPATDSLWPVLFSVYFIGCLLAGAAVAVLWGRRTRLRRERRQAFYIAGFGALTVMLIAFVELVLPEFGHPLPVISPAIAILWVVGIWWGVARHGLLKLTAGLAAEDILATMTDPVVLLDEHGTIVRVNGACSRVFGGVETDWVGRTLEQLLAEGRAADAARLERLVAGGPVPHFETEVRRADDSTFPAFLSAAQVLDHAGGAFGTAVVLRDASEYARTEDRLDHLAHHDPLTDLPNRFLFGDRLDHALGRARRRNEALAVMMLDLDHFKEVNDTLGHEAGDLLLRAVAERLTGCIRRSDTVARMGGDEFVFVLPDLKQAADVRVVAERIVAALARPVDVAGSALTVAASIGIALFPAHGRDAAALLTCADAAMYRVKATGRRAWRVFDPAAGDTTTARPEEPGRIREALERGELVLHYQPQREPATGRVAAVEALLRWQHPERGLLPPTAFLPAAAESGAVGEICGWATRAAAAQAQAWRVAGLAVPRLAVNLGPQELLVPDLPERLRRALESTGLPAEALELEITEDVAAQDETMLRTLERVRQLGVRIAVDAFGTGPTSLVFLARFPVQTLKIAPAFVRGVPEHAERAAVVRAIIALARALHVERVVAEGVETSEQLEFLRSVGIDAVQGHFIGRPASAQETATLLATRA
ncbi:MAG: EAL domain-containing protein [Deltaproteobacteria bacterium]|nr:EAL domain-containing protein [Deltaproteobacteria bacterium]